MFTLTHIYSRWYELVMHLLLISIIVHAENGEGEDEIRLSPADVKRYESRFSGFVFHCNNLELKETIGEGLAN